MKLSNETVWRTDQLRALIARVAEEELDPEIRRRLLVEIRPGRRRYIHGRAGLGGAHVRLWLPAPVTRSLRESADGRPVRRLLNAARLAFVVAHELAHCRGMDHRKMRGNPRYSWVEGWEAFYGWAAEIAIEPQPAPPRPGLAARRQARVEHARALLARWERAARLAARRAQRWRRRLRAAERRLAEAATPTPPAEVQP